MEWWQQPTVVGAGWLFGLSVATWVIQALIRGRLMSRSTVQELLASKDVLVTYNQETAQRALTAQQESMSAAVTLMNELSAQLRQTRAG
jgi:hypothetical protein